MGFESKTQRSELVNLGGRSVQKSNSLCDQPLDFCRTLIQLINSNSSKKPGVNRAFPTSKSNFNSTVFVNFDLSLR